MINSLKTPSRLLTDSKAPKGKESPLSTSHPHRWDHPPAPSGSHWNQPRIAPKYWLLISCWRRSGENPASEGLWVSPCPPKISSGWLQDQKRARVAQAGLQQLSGFDLKMNFLSWLENPQALIPVLLAKAMAELGRGQILPRACWVSGGFSCRNWRRLRSCWRCSVGRFPFQKELEVTTGRWWHWDRVAGASRWSCRQKNGKPVTEGALLGALGQRVLHNTPSPGSHPPCLRGQLQWEQRLGTAAGKLCSVPDHPRSAGDSWHVQQDPHTGASHTPRSVSVELPELSLPLLPPCWGSSVAAALSEWPPESPSITPGMINNFRSGAHSS